MGKCKKSKDIATGRPPTKSKGKGKGKALVKVSKCKSSVKSIKQIVKEDIKKDWEAMQIIIHEKDLILEEVNKVIEILGKEEHLFLKCRARFDTVLDYWDGVAGPLKVNFTKYRMQTMMEHCMKCNAMREILQDACCQWGKVPYLDLDFIKMGKLLEEAKEFINQHVRGWGAFRSTILGPGKPRWPNLCMLTGCKMGKDCL